MYQEIDISLIVTFAQPQYRMLVGRLDSEIKYHLHSRNTYPFEPNPVEVTELESSINNMHIRFTTSIDARHDSPRIEEIIGQRVKSFLPWGVLNIETVSMREEAEIYGNV